MRQATITLNLCEYKVKALSNSAFLGNIDHRFQTTLQAHWKLVSDWLYSKWIGYKNKSLRIVDKAAKCFEPSIKKILSSKIINHEIEHCCWMVWRFTSH